MRWLMISFIALGLSACSNKMDDLKSPCVGASTTGEQNPCDRRAPSHQYRT